MTARLTRRSFVKSTALVGFGLPLIRTASGADASDRLIVGCIGVGGKGWSDMTEVAKSPHVTIKALCDIEKKKSSHIIQKIRVSPKV